MTEAELIHVLEGTQGQAESHVFPKETWDKLAQAGLFQSNFDDAPALMECMATLGEHCHDGGLSFAVGAHLFGSQKAMETFPCDAGILEKVRKGAFVAHAITEESAGSNVFAMKTRAKAIDKGYHIIGSKAYISGVSEAEYILVYAVTDVEKGTMGGISAFLLSPDEIKITQTHEKMGLSSCSMSDFSFDTVVPASRMLGKEGAGFGMFSLAMDWERIGLSAIHLGSMQGILQQCVQYIKQRKVGDEILAKKQAVQFKLADMATRIEASKLMVQRGTQALSEGRQATQQSARTKLYVSEAYVYVCREAMQLFGAKGYLKTYGIERAMRDSLASTIYSGTSEVQRNIIAAWLR